MSKPGHFPHPFGLRMSKPGSCAGFVACLAGGRRPGVARHASNFLSRRRKKVTKERATLLRASLRCATGNLRCSHRGCAAELTARYALRSNNCGKSVHEARVSFGTRTHPLPCASRHAQKGTQGADIHTGHCFAALRSAPSRGRKRLALRSPGRAQRRPVGLFGCLGCPAPSGCACGGVVAG